MSAIQTILHPTDLSESSQPARELAVRLAHDRGARLILLHVVAIPTAYADSGMMIPVAEMQQQKIAADRHQLEQLAAGADAECRVVEGAAAAEILRTAHELPCDLIVMGTHGRGGVQRLLFGSVAAEVLRHAPCPVLAVKLPGTAPQPARTQEQPAPAAAPGGSPPPLFPVILHPTDFSDRSRHAFDVACALAQGGGRLIVLHVVQGAHVMAEGYEQALHAALRTLRPDDPSVPVEYRLRAGDVAAEILAEAAATGCDLIALSTHGRTGLDRFLTGSVAEAVLQRAGCKVLAVKGPAQPPAQHQRSPLAATLF